MKSVGRIFTTNRLCKVVSNTFCFGGRLVLDLICNSGDHLGHLFEGPYSTRADASRRLLLQHRLIAAGRHHDQIATPGVLSGTSACPYDCS